MLQSVGLLKHEYAVCVNHMNDLHSPTHLKALCKQYRLTPSKKYGQNYLISSAPIQKMIAAAALTKKDTVVEIGPGFGVLTLAIAPLVKQVFAFEIEKKLKPYWEEQQVTHPNVSILWGNALKEFDVHADTFGASYSVLANLPYQITSNALRTLLEATNKPKQIIVMVQKEVAQRMCAKAGDMSLLAVSVQYYGVPRIIAKVPRGSFWPPPNVDSAVVAIDDISQKQYSDLFFRVVRAGFANKRKQLWRNLSEGLDLSAEKVKGALEAVGVDQRVRAQALTVEAWEALTKKISTDSL